MLTFFGYVGKSTPKIIEFDQKIQKTLTNVDKFTTESICLQNVYFAYSNFKGESVLPSNDQEKKVTVITAGHLYEWTDGSSNSSENDFSNEVMKRYIAHGIGVFNGCKGKFAIAIVDKRYDKCKVHLITDRCGFYPFYYYVDNDGICFSTQAESIGVCGIYTPRLDIDSITQVLNMGVVYNRKTFYDNVNGIQAGHLVTFENGTCQSVQFMEKMPWPDKPNDKYLDSVDSFAFAIKKSVNRLGSYCKSKLRLKLSGGCDSRILLGCLLEQNIDFEAVTNYEFDRDTDPDSSRAQQLQKLFGFPLSVENSSVPVSEEIGEMMLKRFGVIKGAPNEYKLTGSGSADFLERWIKPFEQANVIASERAFGQNSLFTRKCIDSLTLDVRDISKNILENRMNNYWGHDAYRHNMEVVFCTYLKTDDTAKSKPQQLFLGNCHYPNFDEDVMIAVANYPLLLPARKVKFFTEVLKRHFHPDMLKVDLTHLLEKSTPEPGRKGSFKNSDFYSGRELLRLYPDTKKVYEEKARKILNEPGSFLLGNVLSEECLNASFFPIHFSLAIIYWNSWKQLYFPSM